MEICVRRLNSFKDSKFSDEIIESLYRDNTTIEK